MATKWKLTFTLFMLTYDKRAISENCSNYNIKNKAENEVITVL